MRIRENMSEITSSFALTKITVSSLRDHANTKIAKGKESETASFQMAKLSFGETGFSARYSLQETQTELKGNTTQQQL
jgi:hypothetical protein